MTDGFYREETALTSNQYQLLIGIAMYDIWPVRSQMAITVVYYSTFYFSLRVTIHSLCSLDGREFSLYFISPVTLHKP